MNSVKNTILVIAAHPDDEVLGCGGAIAWHKDKGDAVYIRIFAEGITSRLVKGTQELSRLHQCSQEAGKILGADSVKVLNLPDNRLDSLDRLDIIQMIEKEISEIQPDTVYVHHCGDVNIDHRRLHEGVVTACRPVPESNIRKILSYEIQSSTEWQPPGSAAPFLPNWYIDISKQLERKLRALEIYAEEMRPWPHARSIKAVEHLIKLRGSHVGCEAAEAFRLLRYVE